MTLYSYLKNNLNIEGVTVWDENSSMEVYFYRDILQSNRSWNKGLVKLAKKLTIVQDWGRSGVVVNIAEVVSRNINKPIMQKLFYDVRTDYIIYDLHKILNGEVDTTAKWLNTFADSLD